NLLAVPADHPLETSAPVVRDLASGHRTSGDLKCGLGCALQFLVHGIVGGSTDLEKAGASLIHPARTGFVRKICSPAAPLENSSMAILQKTARSAAFTIASVCIGLSVLGAVGVWYVDCKAAQVVRQGFGLIETAVAAVDAGAGRVHDLIASSRIEV